MTKKNMIGLFGGTFDPIHNGHLYVAKTLLEKLKLERIDFIPCGHPPHRKTPAASPEHRLAMVELAIAPENKFTVNDIEIKRAGPSYSIDTIRALHQSTPDHPLAFILSTNAFIHFNEWHDWRSILDLCQLVVVDRSNFPLPTSDWATEIKIHFEKINPPKISATNIRQHIHSGNIDAISQDLPKSVLDYIQAHQLYTK